MQAVYRAGSARLSARRSQQGGRTSSQRSVRVWSEAPKQEAKPAGGQPVISEDVLARLQAAEEEAARLRKQLADAQTKTGTKAAELVDGKPRRIDSTDNRETILPLGGKPKQRAAWLSEADVDFFTGGAPGESGGAAPSEQEVKTVNKRLILGGLATAGLVAFALVPTEKLRPRPSKPLFFYLVPLLRIQLLLDQCDDVIADGDFSTLRSVLSRIKGDPNDAKANLEAAVAWIDDAKTATKAQETGFAFIEFLEQMDYNGYYDSMPRQALTGSQVAQFAAFSAKALASAKTKLAAFLALMPEEQLEAARLQLQ